MGTTWEPAIQIPDCPDLMSKDDHPIYPTLTTSLTYAALSWDTIQYVYLFSVPASLTIICAKDAHFHVRLITDTSSCGHLTALHHFVIFIIFITIQCIYSLLCGSLGLMCSLSLVMFKASPLKCRKYKKHVILGEIRPEA